MKRTHVLVHPGGALYCKWDRYAGTYQLTFRDIAENVEEWPKSPVEGMEWAPAVVIVKEPYGEVLQGYDKDDEDEEDEPVRVDTRDFDEVPF